jgi:hypothetical protein
LGILQTVYGKEKDVGSPQDPFIPFYTLNKHAQPVSFLGAERPITVVVDPLAELGNSKFITVASIVGFPRQSTSISKIFSRETSIVSTKCTHLHRLHLPTSIPGYAHN